MNASTLLDFFNHLGKSPTEASAAASASPSGASTSGRYSSLNGALDRVAVKEEPLSEEDLRALQKDRQKKDNHNMSKRFIIYLFASLIGFILCSWEAEKVQYQWSHQRTGHAPSQTTWSVSDIQ